MTTLIELKHQVDELLKSFTDETQVVVVDKNNYATDILRELKVGYCDLKTGRIVNGINSITTEPVVTIKIGW